MRGLWRIALIPALYAFFSASFAYSYEFGPRPMFSLMEVERGDSFYGLYSYHNLLFNAHTFAEQSVDGRSIETTDIGSHVQPHHKLNLSTDIFFGVDAGISYMTNRFSQGQEESLPYDEVQANLKRPIDGAEGFYDHESQEGYLYAGYRRVSQHLTTHYDVGPGATPGGRETLNYNTTLDVAKLGTLSTEGVGASGLGTAEVFGGLTYVRLDTVLPGFNDEDDLVALPFTSHSLGLTFNGSVTFIHWFVDEDSFFSPYLTVGYTTTFFGISRMNETWAGGMSFGLGIVEGEGVLDSSFEVGLGTFLSDFLRLDANLYFNGVGLKIDDYEQALGQGGLAFSVEVGV